jgi:hypothetical protein
MLTTVLLALGMAASAMATNPTAIHPGTTPPLPGHGNLRAMWSEPPDLNGWIMSSEIIGSFGYESELANDFISTEPTITHVTWWGGFVDISEPCDPETPTAGFNLRFFEDANCIPGHLIADLPVSDFTVEFVWCQQAFYPEYQYEADVNLAVVPGNRYWFCAQMQDHVYPPSWGRLGTARITDCAGQWRSAYYGDPNWVGACEIIFEACDFSQEFEGDHSEACCFPDARCEYLLTSDCLSTGGAPQGPGTSCDPNPCASTPARRSTWGSVRALYR